MKLLSKQLMTAVIQLSATGNSCCDSCKSMLEPSYKKFILPNSEPSPAELALLSLFPQTTYPSGKV